MQRGSRSPFSAIGIALAIAALYPVVSDAWGETDEPRILRSPGGRWSLLFWDSVEEVKVTVYLAPSDRPKDKKLLLECNRWAGGEWSPDERWFAVVRQPDGHMTDLVIYQISGDPADPTRWSAEEEYRTPQRDRYDSHWKILSWNLPEGTVRISCEFCLDSNHPARSVVKRTYVVPIDLQPSAKRPQVPSSR